MNSTIFRIVFAVFMAMVSLTAESRSYDLSLKAHDVGPTHDNLASVGLSWKRDTGITSYKIYINYKLETEVWGEDSRFLVENLRPNKYYTFSVAAYKRDVLVTQTAITWKTFNPPHITKPWRLQGKVLTGSTLSLKWNKNDARVTSLYVAEMEPPYRVIYNNKSSDSGLVLSNIPTDEKEIIIIFKSYIKEGWTSSASSQETFHLRESRKIPPQKDNPVLYEDAEDKKIIGWKVYDNSPTGATIKNVYDTSRKSRVIEVSGSGISNGFKLGGKWQNHIHRMLNWSMKTNKSYVVYISLNTKKGHRYVYYTNASTNWGMNKNGKYIHYGLGNTSSNGHWHNFSRDIEADLRRYERDNWVISINGILIRGNMRIDDISGSKNKYGPAGPSLDTF